MMTLQKIKVILPIISIKIIKIKMMIMYSKINHQKTHIKWPMMIIKVEIILKTKKMKKIDSMMNQKNKKKKKRKKIHNQNKIN